MASTPSAARAAPRNGLARVVDSPVFGGIVFAAILGNAAVLGLQTYASVVREYGRLLEAFDTAFLGVFVVELGLRLASHGRRPQDFLRTGWNVFDLVVVLAAFTPGLGENSTLLRLVRLLRVVRLVRLFPDLRVLLVAVARSIPPLASMSVLTTLILFVYGMVGWVLFAEGDPESWGNIGRAMLTLFVLLSLENLPDRIEAGMDIHPWSWIYFVSYALVAAFIVLNVLIGVVLNSMEEARDIEQRRVLDADAAPGEDPRVVEARRLASRVATLRTGLADLERDLLEVEGLSGSASESPDPGRGDPAAKPART